MTDSWDDKTPIYQQLRQRVVGYIISGAFLEGEAVPSVRQVSSDLRINHLTVSKAYQALVDNGVLEKRRGLGMFVVDGAREKLLAESRTQFEQEEVPQMVQRANSLGVSSAELIEIIESFSKGK